MSLRFYKGDIQQVTGNNIIVFGSNPQGRHGWGLAKLAVEKCGAQYGKGRGLQGNSYALVTKNLTAGYEEFLTGYVYDKEGYRSVPPKWIKENIQELYMLAEYRKELKFFIGYKANNRNLNGYSPKEMIGFFVDGFTVPDNIRFHNSFRPVLRTMGYL